MKTDHALPLSSPTRIFGVVSVPGDVTVELFTLRIISNMEKPQSATYILGLNLGNSLIPITYSGTCETSPL